ncbi:MAG: DUF123 domain-containing protein [Phycisphaerae bacterium]|nr:DUF123 domain-containing protein [Phycisphaerae bacterium]
MLIRLRSAASICVGRLGLCRFPAGWYVYTGSARNGPTQRVGWHLRHDKLKHWHIDYLLAIADRVEAFVLPGTVVTTFMEARAQAAARDRECPPRS